MVKRVVLLNEQSEKLTAEELTLRVDRKGVTATGFFEHSKASERYVILSVSDGDATKEWYLPYYYRRTNVRIDTTAELVDYVRDCVGLFSRENVASFKAATGKLSKTLFGKNASVTLPIFKKLLDNCGDWVWNKQFANPNPQRRIQAIKETGFTLATKIEGRKTYHSLLPFDIVKAPTYEVISSKARRAIFKALGGIDAYSGKPASLSALPDHKFPEIRWSAGVEESNEGLSEEAMRVKFQLVPERINQEKREVCRTCFQSGIRGKLNGIDYFYHGDERWPANVPTVGPAAKVGCHGCFWFDMAEWRKSLNRLVKEKRKS